MSEVAVGPTPYAADPARVDCGDEMTVAVKLSVAANGPAIPAALARLTSNAAYAEELADVPLSEIKVMEVVSTEMPVVAPCTTAVALDGTTESIPRPKAATATSATRLKVVFVDICFLSISRSREFLPFGLELKFLTPVR
jgi:hypothetical protein